jgi:hypothetical protein
LHRTPLFNILTIGLTNSIPFSIERECVLGVGWRRQKPSPPVNHGDRSVLHSTPGVLWQFADIDRIPVSSMAEDFHGILGHRDKSQCTFPIV